MKYRLDSYLWEVKEGIPVSVKLDEFPDYIYVRQDIVKKKENNNNVKPKKTYEKQPVPPTQKDYDRFWKWIKPKHFFYPYDFQKVIKKFPKYKINGIIERLLKENKIIQYKGDEFRVLHKEVIKA